MAKTGKVGVLLRLATLSGLSWWLSGKKKKICLSMQESMSSISGSGRSPEEGNGNPLQDLAWEIPWIEEPSGL